MTRTSTSTAAPSTASPSSVRAGSAAPPPSITRLGEALGQVYVEQYFAGDSKAKALQMVHDIEAAMNKDLDTLDWMSPATREKAKAKLHAIADKIGYPEHWRDYSKLEISRTDALGNLQRANAFENDRELNKIGTPVDKLEWGMSPPTVNAYYNDSMNDINFPAGILQPAFYDPKADLATNYGHMGAVIGHELTHGFDDQGSQFDASGNLSDWWTPEDKKNFEARTGCLVNEYGSFVAVDDLHVNGKLTLGENTADNGGLRARLHGLPRTREEGRPRHSTRRSTASPARSASTSPTARTGARTHGLRSSARRSRPTPTLPTTSAPTAPSSTNPTSAPPSAARQANP